MCLLAGLLAAGTSPACDRVTSGPSAEVSVDLATQKPENVRMRPGPVMLAQEFTAEEIFDGALALTKDRTQAEWLAGELLQPPAGAVLDADHEFLTVLALMSDDLTVRVGRLRGLTAEQAREWAQPLLEEHGHPSTWDVEWADGDDG